MDGYARIKKTYSKTSFFTDFIFHQSICQVVYVCPNTDIYVSDIDYMYILFENASEVDFLIRA